MSDAPATAYVRGAGGAIFEMDIPTAGMALERWEAALEKGELTIVDHAHWVERGDGSKYLVAGPGDHAPAAKKRSAKKPAGDDTAAAESNAPDDSVEP